jgi:antitoxin ParD1/3/4
MRVSLRPDLEKFIEEKVRNGQYADVDAVVNDAVEMLKEQNEREELSPEDAQKLEELRREIQIGIDQADRGEFVEFTAEDIIREGEAELRRRRGEGNGH